MFCRNIFLNGLGRSRGHSLATEQSMPGVCPAYAGRKPAAETITTLPSNMKNIPSRAKEFLATARN